MSHTGAGNETVTTTAIAALGLDTFAIKCRNVLLGVPNIPLLSSCSKVVISYTQVPKPPQIDPELIVLD